VLKLKTHTCIFLTNVIKSSQILGEDFVVVGSNWSRS